MLLAVAVCKLLVSATVSRNVQPLMVTNHSSETVVVEAVTLLVAEFGLAIEAVPTTTDQVPTPGEADVAAITKTGLLQCVWLGPALPEAVYETSVAKAEAEVITPQPLLNGDMITR